jgi:cell wall assembly regulator SMI1
MQKFTRALTREIEVGGERLAVTLSETSLTIRPVGSRRPPHTMTWTACVQACVAGAGKDQAPTAEELTALIKALKAGGREKAGETPPAEAAHPAEPVATLAKETPPAVASPPANDSLAGLLARVDHWLGEHRRRFHHALLPGATPAECEALQAAIGSPLPEELRTWLGWHNGQNADVMGAFEEGWNLMSCAQIAETKKELDGAPHEGWQRSWIPFLDDDQGNYLCLDPGPSGVPIRECWRGQPEHPVAAPSLTHWVQNFLSGLEKGSYHEDAERGAFHRA